MPGPATAAPRALSVGARTPTPPQPHATMVEDDSDSPVLAVQLMGAGARRSNPGTPLYSVKLPDDGAKRGNSHIVTSSRSVPSNSADSSSTTTTTTNSNNNTGAGNASAVRTPSPGPTASAVGLKDAQQPAPSVGAPNSVRRPPTPRRDRHRHTPPSTPKGGSGASPRRQGAPQSPFANSRPLKTSSDDGAIALTSLGSGASSPDPASGSDPAGSRSFRPTQPDSSGAGTSTSTGGNSSAPLSRTSSGSSGGDSAGDLELLPLIRRLQRQQAAIDENRARQQQRAQQPKQQHEQQQGRGPQLRRRGAAPATPREQWPNWDRWSGAPTSPRPDGRASGCSGDAAAGSSASPWVAAPVPAGPERDASLQASLWLAGGLVVAGASCGAVVAAHALLALLVKAAGSWTLAWTAATGVAGVQGLTVGTWAFSERGKAECILAEERALRTQEAAEAETRLLSAQAARAAEVARATETRDALERVLGGLTSENRRLQLAVRDHAERSALARATAQVQGDVGQLLRLVQDMREEVLCLSAAATPAGASVGGGSPAAGAAGTLEGLGRARRGSVDASLCAAVCDALGWGAEDKAPAVAGTKRSSSAPPVGFKPAVAAAPAGASATATVAPAGSSDGEGASDSVDAPQTPAVQVCGC